MYPFVRNWNSPPRYTTMHRPGIASVVDDEILLNGTTIEEVREYHRGTLKLCIEKSNTQEKKILLEEEQKKRERMSESDHIKKVFRN